MGWGGPQNVKVLKTVSWEALACCHHAQMLSMLPANLPHHAAWESTLLAAVRPSSCQELTS
jgi:hypothetical protein